MSRSAVTEAVTPRSETIQNTMALPCLAMQCFDCLSIESAISLLSNWKPASRPLVLGGGSNVILPAQIDGPLIRIKAKQLFLEELDQSSAMVIAEAGMVWDELVSACVNEGLYGIENLSWIPGTVGAAPVQNIGAYGCELRDVLEYVDVFDWGSGKVERLFKGSCEFAYRDSIFKRNPDRFVILRVCLKLKKTAEFNLEYGELRPLQDENDLSLMAVRKRVIEVRQAKLPDPDLIPNAGSFFKNPIVPQSQCQTLKEHHPGLIAYSLDENSSKLAAGWLIDQAGWKGKAVGNVRVHDKQALVLTNSGNASQSEVRDVANRIINDISQCYGVQLEVEPIFII